MDQNNQTSAENKKLPPCCHPAENPDNRKGFLWGIVYGILPHTFCILFIVFSVIGATAGAAFFGKFLALPWFFPTLIALSFAFATISALFYLRRNKRLSAIGIKNSGKYLLVLYGTTLGVSLLFIYVIFPAVIGMAYNRASEVKTAEQTATPQNPSSSVPTQNPQAAAQTALITITVDIPCPGHAPLIIEELKKIDGVTNVTYGNPNVFNIEYDQDKTSKDAILMLEIFKTYKTTENKAAEK